MKSETRSCEVAVLGAGPYGLSVAAHLRFMGIETRVFGEPMEFWQHQMPNGMLLRSSKRASNIAAPNDSLGLDDYAATVGARLAERLRLEDFIEYGLWFQQRAVPDVERRNVSKLEVSSNGFRLTLEDGEPVESQRVVVAAGIGSFAHRPLQFSDLPLTLASHTSEHSDFGKFAGARVVVIGGGQSAFESAALLLESGAEVEIIVRAPRVRWLKSSGIQRQKGLIHSILYPPTEVGPLGFNQIIARPALFRMVPVSLKECLTYSAIRPMVSDWLAPRLSSARIRTSCSVVSTTATRNGLRLTLDDGATCDTDHVFLGTGYRIDIARYQFIAPSLLRLIAMVSGYPQLTHWFESSVRGLFFVGAVAGSSFGPLVRFVAGTAYCARKVGQVIGADLDANARKGSSGGHAVNHQTTSKGQPRDNS